MPALFDGGFVYIAKPPLYRVKVGSRETYVEKESELEEILLRDKLEKMEVFDRAASPFSLTHQRWQRFTRLLKEYEGWASSLRAEYGHETVTFLEESEILDKGLTDPAQVVKQLKAKAAEGEPYDTEVQSEDDGVIVVKVVERKTGLARTHRLPRVLFESREYRQLVRVHEELVKLCGVPPFTLKLGDHDSEALSFEGLRRSVLELCRKGVQLQRFKGLGEMNADQLRETTMDPETRTLAQVTMDDAAVADRLFTMLMGDKVEPRREFIEENARVATLDV